MKQTVTANISGIVFHIEVDAYEKLNQYLDKIKGYFKNSSDCDEIMSDIEARIAELLNPKLGLKNQAISIKDIEEIIEVMGKPEQYVVEDEEQEGQGRSNSMADQPRTRRRLFRDPDDRVLGGVAAGIGHYVGLDPVWIRLLFVIVFLVGGSGFLIYVILWIVMPEAKTSGDKLQMKGEPVNIENIGKAFEDGAKKVNERIRNLDSSNFGQKMEEFFESLFHVLTVLITGFLKLFGKIIGVALLVLGIFLVMMFIGGFMSSDTVIYALSPRGVFSFDSRELFMTIFNSESQYSIVRYSLMVFFGVPILALIYGGVKLIFGIKGKTGIGMGLGILWLVGLASCIFFGFQLGSEFKSKSDVTEYKGLSSGFKEYVLEVSSADVPGDEMIRSDDEDFLLSFDKSNVYCGKPSLNIERSYKDSLQLKIVKQSYGFSKKTSLEKARAINYEVNQIGELLSFNPYLSFEKQEKIRGQEVELTLLLPLGKVVYLDESLDGFIYDIENVTDTRDSQMLGKKWIMLENGLTCLDCAEIEGITSEELLD